ncbi:P-loop containing nucleoside triphosphate hydrolase protein [Obba rivulosa]|uniref:P-loop containing nucleoside triphosphate hydrolase protein n=1 Tax=Obba rivulosa TaxID=1052685 RepID=A0A8E2DLT8_9APHY|nr:P-loop containing nucleoside triphosphate hydrolase protein [Obba rivulosa]
MVKRRAALPDSDGEEIFSQDSHMPKRARTEEDSADEQPESSQNARKHTKRTNGKQRAEEEPALDLDDDDEPVEQDAPDEDEERRFEEEHEEEIRAKLMSKDKTQGGVAEMGIIESLEMHQFMCHKYLTFNLGPQINFIIGHNGSGKSAVLSALTVALGGKATSTGRGNGLKSFIREGQSVSEVTVVLKNQGEEAYRPQDYGKSIVITRKFTKDGSSSYRIKSKDGKLISQKREELSKICDHMNIQVDNPMNILTQDAARQFLSASQPADKYRFFLKGTQLSQLSEEYQTCLESIGSMTKSLKRNSEALPDLKEALAEATARFDEAKKAREQRHKADELKKELAWAHVNAKAEEFHRKQEELEKAKKRPIKIEEGLKKAENDLRVADEKVTALEHEAQDQGDIEHLMAQKTQCSTQIKENRKKLSTIQEEQRTMNRDMEQLKIQIDKLDKQINTEIQRLESFSQERRDTLDAQLQVKQAEIAEAEAELESVRAQKVEKQAEVERLASEGRRLNQERENVRSQIMSLREQLDRCDQRERNKFAPYGKEMDKVVADIQRARWVGHQPVGPFGLYVKVREPERWAPLMRVQLGQLMGAFAVTDARDRRTLEQILRNHGNSGNPIIIADVDLFDYSRGEPSPDYLTVLRALDISNEYILRILINSAQIERVFLAPTRADADRVLQSVGGGMAWAADSYRVQRFPDGGGMSNPLPRLDNRGDWRHQLFTGDDVTAQRSRWQDELRAAEADLAPLDAQMREGEQAYRSAQQTVASLNTQERTLGQKIFQLKQERNALQEAANEELPVNIQAVQAAKEDVEKDKDAVANQFTASVQKKAAIDHEQKSLVAERDRLNALIADFEGKRVEKAKEIEDAVQKRLEAQNSIKYFTEKLEREKRKVEDLDAAAKTLAQEFTAWTAKAEEYCTRVETNRSVAEIDRNLKSVQEALRESEKRNGVSVEDMAAEVKKRQEAVDAINRSLRETAVLTRSLKKSVKLRLARWHEFRRHIALRCKVYFQYHLSNRGYYGKVLFDHVHGTLQLKVQTEDQTMTQNNREKDPRSLSGGEKSFSTICLLLSLWESIGCPIRCLDEFDVFMDAVNRRISMRMMIDTANASDRKQYVLITPQDMTNISIGSTVRVHRMTDPERGQGVLAFQ